MLIGEVSRLSGVSVRMLRHYDSTGLLTPSHRTSAGYRQYSRSDTERLMRIEALRSLGMGLADVRTALDDPGLEVDAVLDRLRDETRARLAAEQELLAHLDDIAGVHGPPADTWDDVLHLTALLSSLRAGTATERQAAVLRTPPGRALSALVDSYLDEDDPNTAGALRWSVTKAGADAADALTPHLADATPTIRRRITEALVDIDGSAATEALTSLVSQEPRAALELAHRGRHTPEVVTRLVGMVAAGQHDVDAAEALAMICTARPETEGGVIDELRHRRSSDPEVRLRIVQALAEIGGPSAMHGLRSFTEDTDQTVARTALALSRPSPDGRTCPGR